MKIDSGNIAAKEAADWVLRQQERLLSKSERMELADWLRQSPLHVCEYIEIASLWQEMSSIDSLRAIDVEELLATDTVVPMPGNSVSKQSETEPRSRWWRVMTIAAGLAVVALLIQFMVTGSIIVNDKVDSRTVSTELGEQRLITLEDGSIVQLNTKSLIRIRFEDDLRYIDLQEGEALFSVAHDMDRPFVVQVGGVAVRAVGTRFNVRRQGDASTIAVVEGKVIVGQCDSVDLLPHAAAPNVVALEIGQVVNIDQQGAAGEPAAIRSDMVVAWTKQRLIFDGHTLREIVAEFNRYNVRKIRIENSGIEMMRFNGVFDANDSGSFLDYIQSVSAIEVEMKPDGTNVLSVADSDGQLLGQ